MTSHAAKDEAARAATKAHIDTRAYNALAVAIRNAQILRLARVDAERALKALDGLQSDPEASEALRKAVLIITRQLREAGLAFSLQSFKSGEFIIKRDQGETIWRPK